MSLLVYIPGGVQKKRGKHLLYEAGLDALIDEGSTVNFVDVVANGPDGGGGFVVSWDCQIPVALDLANQEWHELPESGNLPQGRAWIGWDKRNRPTPATLKRTKTMPGKFLELADGNEWLIPVARQLPCVVGKDNYGKPISKGPIARYREFYERSFQVLSEFMGKDGQNGGMDFPEAFAYSVSVLQINYRVTDDVVDKLGLLTTDLLWTIPETVTEFPLIVAQLTQKKSAPDGESSSSGDAVN